jgi:hypothetical protein
MFFRFSRIVGFGLAAGLVVAASAALAGSTFPEGTAIYPNADGSGEFVGAFSSARFSSDNQQFVDCVVQYNGPNPTVGGDPVVVLCTARDSTGKAAGCWNFDPAFAEVARSLNDTSELSVWYDKNATCTRIQVTKASYYIH